MFDHYPDYEYLFARIQLVLFMLAMGTALAVADFVHVVRQPQSLLVGLAGHFLLVPALALAVNGVFALESGFAIGLILVALMPSSSLSKVLAHLGRGNMALTITMTVCTTLATLISVPVMLGLLAVQSPVAVPVDDVVQMVGVYLLLPLGLGMGVARLAPRQRRLIGRGCVVLGWLVVAIMMGGALGSGRIRPAEYGWQAPLAIIVFCLLIQQGSMMLFYVFRWPRRDRLAIGMETTMRNMNLALLIVTGLFPGDPIGGPAQFVIFYYAAVAMAAGLPLALNHLRLARKEDRR